MNRLFKIGWMVLLSLSITANVSRAQSVAQCLEQLTLDYQKLAGLKSILQQMYKGYAILNKGYSAVKDVSQGNFNLHEAFLDGLMVVSPAIRNYPRVADIMNDQVSLISEYKTAASAFRHDPHFKPDEISYMAQVYNRLVGESLKTLDDLSMAITDSKLRMNDAERIKTIDQLYQDSHDQMGFLRRFNDRAYKTALQRARNANDTQTLQILYGIK